MSDSDNLTQGLDPTSRHDLRLLGVAMRALSKHTETVAQSLAWLAGATAQAAVDGDMRLAIRGLGEMRQWLKMELDHQEKTQAGEVIDVESGPYDVSRETARLLTRIDAELERRERAASGEQSSGGVTNGVVRDN